MKKLQPINDILRKVLRELGLEKKFQEYQVVASWEDIVGEKVADHTFAYDYDNKLLFVKVDSSVWLQQLVLLKIDFIKKLNKKFGRKIVKDIIFKIATEEDIKNRRWNKR